MTTKLRAAATAFLLTAVILLSGVSVAFSQPTKASLVVLNKAEASMAIIDPVSMKLIAKVPVGDGPHEVVFSADGKTAYAANYGAQTPGSSISVIDIASAKELRRIDTAPLLRPHGLQVVGGKLYFTAETNRIIARYDPTANKIDWMMGTGQNVSHMIAVSADQKRFYTANIGSDSITAIELPPLTAGRVPIIHIPVGKQPEAIDLSPDGKEVWTGLNVDGAIDIVDTTTNKFKEKVNIGGRPYRVKFTPDGKQVVCTMLASKEIIVLDAATRKVLRRMKLESVPMGIVFSVDGKTAFVTIVEPDAVIKVDLEKMEVKGRVDSGKGPDGIAVAGI